MYYVVQRRKGTRYYQVVGNFSNKEEAEAHKERLTASLRVPTQLEYTVDYDHIPSNKERRVV